MLFNDLLPLNNVFYFAIILISDILFTNVCCKSIVIFLEEKKSLKGNCLAHSYHFRFRETGACLPFLYQIYNYVSFFISSSSEDFTSDFYL